MTMSVPNRFEEAMMLFVADMRALPFPFEHRTWEDSGFGHSIRFSRFGASKHRTIKAEDLLPSNQIDIIKAYCVYLRIQKAVQPTQVNQIVCSLKLFCLVLQDAQSPLHSLNAQTYERVLTKIEQCCRNSGQVKAAHYINVFIEYLKSRSAIVNTLKTRQPFQIGHSNKVMSHQVECKKLPDVKVIQATGHIFAQTMPPIGAPIDYLDNAMDRMVCCQIAFSLAAPERVGEIPLLVKQQLAEKTSEQLGKCEDFHFLYWRGSKGMHDFLKLIHHAMVPTIQRVLHYLFVTCEPARILARYYENPRTFLRDFLGNYSIENFHGLCLDQPVSLWQLGGLLGFYDEVDDDSPLREISGFPFSCDLSEKITTNRLKGALLGVNASGFKKSQSNPLNRKTNLEEFEGIWIDWVTNNIPNFPYRQHDNGKQVRLSDALFIYTGKQLVTHKGAYLFGGSPFAIESLDLKAAFSTRLNNKANKSIFKKSGFDGDIYQLTSHQFRHYLNTQAQRGGMSETVLATWSGRASISQNVVYDHRTDDEKHAAIAEIYEQDSGANMVVIPVDEEEFELKTGKVATKMTTGFCIQPLHINPCTRLNACVGCSRSCHVKGDEKVFALIKADLRVQESRLEEVSKFLSKTNRIANDWFRLHTEKANRYRALIEVLTDSTVEDGAVIRFTGEEYKLRITNSEVTQSVEYTPLLVDQSEQDKASNQTTENTLSEDDPLAALNVLIEKMTHSNADNGDTIELCSVQKFLEG